jgi:hypothetical protein
MPAWQTATGAFFVYVGLVAAFLPGLDSAKRRLAIVGAIAGVSLAAAAAIFTHPVLSDWVIPPLVLLTGYWTSGLLFVAPMPAAERVLLAIDRSLEVRRMAAAAPRAIAEMLEVAYIAVYPFIPVALVLYLRTSDAPDASRFWSVILLTDYICFGMLPWIQTRPPRALEPDEPWQARFRSVNLRLLGSTSIQANTFPSGHAAEGLAAALLVASAGPAIATGVFVVGLAISAGAVLGRYHYAADAIAGWAVVLVVWWLTM